MGNELNVWKTRPQGSKLNIVGAANLNCKSGGAAAAATSAAAGEAELGRLPAGVRASVGPKLGEYDARRLRSQMEIIRDVMLSAADCDSWLTLGELRKLTRFGEASISAQLRHLRKAEHGGFEVAKRHREGASPERTGNDRRGDCVWEYRLGRAGRVNSVEDGAEVTEAQEGAGRAGGNFRGATVRNEEPGAALAQLGNG